MCETERASVAIVDYEAGNLFSVKHACTSVGLDPVVVNRPKDITKATALILPGVGAFGNAMETLRRLDLVQSLKDFASSGRPFMGICLGMQLLFTESEEFGWYEGLGMIEGTVKKFPASGENGRKLKVPQIGWNQIFRPSGIETRWDGSPLSQVAHGEFMYFVHSYYASPFHIDDILSVTDYEGVSYCSSVVKDNIFATQFHPEKSAQEGIKIYQDWADMVKHKNYL